jgi:hypothetical protein
MTWNHICYPRKNSFGFVRRKEGAKIGEEATLKCYATTT